MTNGAFSGVLVSVTLAWGCAATKPSPAQPPQPEAKPGPVADGHSRDESRTDTSRDMVPAPVAKAAKPRVIRRRGNVTELEVDGDYVQSGMRFPEAVGQVRRVSITDFGSRGSGHAVGYQAPKGTVITVYVYGAGGSTVRELIKVRKAIQYQTNGKTTFPIEGVVVLLVAGEKSVAHHHVGLRDSGAHTTQSVVFSSGGYYIKYRISAPSNRLAEDASHVTKLITSLALPE